MNAPIIPPRTRMSPYATFLEGAVPIDGMDVPTPILGIDGSVAKLGLAIIWKGRIKAWRWTPKTTGVARLAEIRDEVDAIIRRYAVRMSVVEGYSLGSRNSQSHATGEAGAAVRLALLAQNVTTLEVPPTSLKKFLSGKGNTPKTGMPLALYKRYGVDYENEDQADAAGLAVLGAAVFGGHGKEILSYQKDAIKKLKTILPPPTRK